MGDNNDGFEEVKEALRSGGFRAGFDFLSNKFLKEKNYPALFEARLMQTRHQLDLPLIDTPNSVEMPEEKRRAFDEGCVAAAREVGGLFLADGDILRAWPYYRAIGESAPVAKAIENIDNQDANDAILEIAFYERVHPRKGFELILEKHGTCRAITTFGQYPTSEGRLESAQLLLRTLHSELTANIKRAIEKREGQAPETEGVSELIAGRDWLFGEYDYYVDTSHVGSVLTYSLQLDDPGSLSLAVGLTEYGQRLSSTFQYAGQPPFENLFADHGIYLKALLGEDVDAAVTHFRGKVAASDPNEVGTVPAEVLVGLLARLKRYSEAADVYSQYLGEADPSQLSCPSAVQLCQLAGDFEKLKQLAVERKDLLSFAAGLVQS